MKAASSALEGIDEILTRLGSISALFVIYAPRQVVALVMGRYDAAGDG